MSAFEWKTDSVSVIQAFEVRHPNGEAGALVLWAINCVDTLHYLDDLRHVVNRSHALSAEHTPDLIDVAHVRWATVTSITALDLCAASLGRVFCGHAGDQELDVRFFTTRNDAPARRARLPPPALAWVDALQSDDDYRTILDARHCLTHRRPVRHLRMSGPMSLDVGHGAPMTVEELVDRARDLAARHVVSFLDQLPSI